MLQFQGLVLVLLLETGVLLGQVVELFEHLLLRFIGRGGLGDGELVLQFDDSAVVHVFIP